MSKIARFWISVMVLLSVAIIPAMAAAPAAQTIAAPNQEFSITLLHTNDVHARVDEYNRNGARCTEDDQTAGLCIAGFSRLQTLVEEIRGEVDNVLLLDAGDQFQGTLFYNLFKADVITDTMNALGYDAMTIGNHEFDDGPEELARLIDGANFPIVSSNLDVSGDAVLAGKVPTYTILTENDEQIGIVGVTTPETENISSPGDDVIFEDTVTSLQAAVDALTAQGVDKIVALTHQGYDADLALAAAVTGVDVVIGGHSHTFIYTPTTPLYFYEPQYPQYSELVPAGPYPTVIESPTSEPVLVVTAFQWGTFLGRLDVTFDTDGIVTEYAGNPIYLDRDIEKSATMETILDTYRPAIQELITTEVGTTTVDLPISVGGARVCRIGECLMGNLVADAMMWKANEVEGGYQIAFQNGGGLRAPIMAGAVTMGDVLETLPFGNAIATFELTGTHVIEALENGVSQYPAQSGRFPQVSGMRYTFDASQPAGSRITSVEVMSGTAYVPLDENAVYKVVTNDFMRKGGDGYVVFRDYAIDPYDFGPALDAALAEYFGNFSPVTPVIEGRITILEPDLSTTEKTVVDANGDGVASAGEILTYTINVVNTSEESAAFWLTDTLPSGVTYVPDSLYYNGFPETTEITITGGVLVAKTDQFPLRPDGGSFTINMPGMIRFNVTVDTPLPAGNEIVNQIILRDQVRFYNIAPATIPLDKTYIFLPLVMRAHTAP
ncbi:MAG: 5'-nucleotidase C-terminal domain-containing protein [Anaerolineae bacterium]